MESNKTMNRWIAHDVINHHLWWNVHTWNPGERLPLAESYAQHACTLPLFIIKYGGQRRNVVLRKYIFKKVSLKAALKLHKLVWKRPTVLFQTHAVSVNKIATECQCVLADHVSKDNWDGRRTTYNKPYESHEVRNIKSLEYRYRERGFVG